MKNVSTSSAYSSAIERKFQKADDKFFGLEPLYQREQKEQPQLVVFGQDRKPKMAKIDLLIGGVFGGLCSMYRKRLAIPPKCNIPVDQAFFAQHIRYTDPSQPLTSAHEAPGPSQRSRLFILVPIDFSYTTVFRLSIATFALGRTVQPQYIPYRGQMTDRRNTVA